MANFNQKLTLFLPFFFFLILKLQTYAQGDQQVPCYFIFGDSLADAGNNNILLTLTKSNYPPYGIDFPLGATGRFCNGRTIIDVLTDLLGFKQYIPPFPKAIGRQLLQGVNYASAGSGIRQETGKDLGQRVWLAKQLVQHSNTVSRINGIFGNSRVASDHLSKCLYTVGIGSNDYINNYYKPEIYVSGNIYSPEEYADILAKELETNLKLLHSFGAKVVAVFGLSGIGCTPTVVEKFGGQPICYNKVNSEVQLFNDRVQTLVNRLNKNLNDAKFTYVNITSIFAEILPQIAYINFTASCCERMKDLGTCVPFSAPCSNRSNYEFFDGFHPTESTNKLVGNRIFTTKSPQDISPYTLQQLIAA
ncbi:GDSL esterase/lipase At5g45670-like [Punica granatum]|uniref:GDSL esterase/lipase At5g45670-like n=2 Tax=Punica granatum TaxID=22663 RepID=A0A6P8CJ85_PUNGR|nr:GDSL esterase/lipase At5g45670-like [Punica granatum]PKI53584.1 hypothetical protein CRG98_026034 [Punica granatum]